MYSYAYNLRIGDRFATWIEGVETSVKVEEIRFQHKGKDEAYTPRQFLRIHVSYDYYGGDAWAEGEEATTYLEYGKHDLVVLQERNGRRFL